MLNSGTKWRLVKNVTPHDSLPANSTVTSNKEGTAWASEIERFEEYKIPFPQLAIGGHVGIGACS